MKRPGGFDADSGQFSASQRVDSASAKMGAAADSTESEHALEEAPSTSLRGRFTAARARVTGASSRNRGATAPDVQSPSRSVADTAAESGPVSRFSDVSAPAHSPSGAAAEDQPTQPIDDTVRAFVLGRQGASPAVSSEVASVQSHSRDTDRRWPRMRGFWKPRTSSSPGHFAERVEASPVGLPEPFFARSDAAENAGSVTRDLTELVARAEHDLQRTADGESPGSTDSAHTADRVAEAEREVKRAQRARKQREKRDARRFTARSRQRARHWILGVSAVVLLAAFVAAGVFTPIMAVRQVEIVGGKQIDVTAVEAALQRFDGVPLALVGEQDIHRTLEPFPLIQRYSVERIPPHTLRIHIDERQPVIAIESESGFRLVDAAGVLTAEAAEIPTGIVLATEGVADPTSGAFAAAARVARDVPDDVAEQLASVSATGDQDISFVLHSGVSVFWGDSTNTQRKAVVLRALLASVPGATRFDVSAPEAPVFQ